MAASMFSSTHRRAILLYTSVFLLLAVAYVSNRRSIDAGDTYPTALAAVALGRGDGPFLDRFYPPGEKRSEVLARYWVGESRGHLVSRYPLATSFVLAPFVLPQMWVLDRIRPDWSGDSAGYYALSMAKHTCALMMAAAGTMLLGLLRSLGYRTSALVATLAASLGSDYWVVASQSPWQHGPAAFALTLALWFASRPRPRFTLVGLCLGMLICFRLTDIFPALAILLWVVRDHPKRLIRVLIPMGLLVVPLVAYNYYFFHSLVGGQSVLEGMHEKMHGTSRVWNPNPVPGLLGTLVSPSRGLFIFCPWVALAIAYSPMTIRRAGLPRPIAWAIVSLIPHLLMLSCYSVWWAGYSFGPRYWTDVMPMFAILLAAGLCRAKVLNRPLFVAMLLAVASSVVVQAIGAFYYPSGWEYSPSTIDLDHDRLWDWHDHELSRCLKVGPFRGR